MAKVFLLTLVLCGCAAPSGVRRSAKGEPRAPFSKGSHVVYAYGARGFSNHEKDDILFGALGGGYYVWDGLGLNLELPYYRFMRGGPDPQGGGATAVVRWHFYRTPSWSLYVDVGGGIVYSDHSVPVPKGIRFNFTAQGGPGMTVRLAGGVNLFFGGRFFHLSNASIGPSNPGDNAGLVYAGLMLDF